MVVSESAAWEYGYTHKGLLYYCIPVYFSDPPKDKDWMLHKYSWGSWLENILDKFFKNLEFVGVGTGYAPMGRVRRIKRFEPK